MYCFDTDVLSAVLKRDPPLHLIRRLAQVRPEHQFTTAITLGEMLFGAMRRGGVSLETKVRELVLSAQAILPFDEIAAEVYGLLRADLELKGRPIGEQDLRIASIALSRNLVLVTGNVRHFSRISDLVVEDWITV